MSAATSRSRAVKPPNACLAASRGSGGFSCGKESSAARSNWSRKDASVMVVTSSSTSCSPAAYSCRADLCVGGVDMLVPATDGWSTGQAERCAPRLPVSHPLTLLPLHPDARGSSEPPLSISADEEWAGETDRERDPVLMLISALPSVTRGLPLPVPARVPPRSGRYPALASSVGAGRVAWPLAVRLGPRADRGSSRQEAL